MRSHDQGDCEEDPGPENAGDCYEGPVRQATASMCAAPRGGRELSVRRRRDLMDFAGVLAEQIEQRVPPGPQRCLLRRMVECLLDE